mgnify:CR=1 FL=1
MAKYDITQIKGVIPALLTFFDGQENLDDACTRDMLDFMMEKGADGFYLTGSCPLYTSPSPRDKRQPRMPSSA